MNRRKDWINLEKNVTIVPRHSQKRKRKPKRVPLNSKTEPVVERLYKRAGEDGYLIVNPRTGKPFG